jgi:hypothetical protein
MGVRRTLGGNGPRKPKPVTVRKAKAIVKPVGVVTGEHIVAAAVSNAGTIWTLPAPARHYDVKQHMARFRTAIAPDSLDGYVTSTGRFVHRLQAADIAIEAGQVRELKNPPHLFSDDLW